MFKHFWDEVRMNCIFGVYFFELFILWPVAEDLSGVTEEVSENTNKSNGTDKAEILL